MSKFDHKECIGVTWDKQGACFGVKLKYSGESYTISGIWSTGTEPEEDVPVSLQKGVLDLQAGDNIPVIAGGTALEAASIDLGVPDLQADDLRNLLSYELRKQSPVEEDKVVWGYRKLPDNNHKGDKKSLRLIYLRDTVWHRWLDNVSSITGGVDALLPPFAAVDPQLCDMPVMAGDDGCSAYIMVPDYTGRRTMLQAGQVSANTFGALPEPLAAPNLETGPLADLPPEEQQCYAGAVMLALYGLAGTLRDDRKTSLPVPVELRRRPHKTSFRLGMILALYLVAALIFMGLREYAEAGAYLADLETKITQTRQEITELSETRNPRETVQAVRREVDDLRLNEPSMTECLIEITSLLNDRYWVSSMNWNEGKIHIEVRTMVDDLSFVDKLEESPILADVVPVRKVVDHQKNLVIKVQLHATADENDNRDRPSVSVAGESRH